MKTWASCRTALGATRPARIVAWSAVALLGAGLAAATVSPEFAAWVWRNAEKPRAALVWSGSAVLWAAALALGLMVRRRGRGAGPWRTAGTLALLTTAMASGLAIGLIVAVPYFGVLLAVEDVVFMLAGVYGSALKVDQGVVALAGSLITAGAFGLSALAWRVGARAGHGVAAWLLVFPVCVYLARDDAEWRNMIELEEFAPPRADAVVAGEILLRYARGGEPARAFKEPELFRKKRVPPTKAGEWVGWVADNRGEVADIWAELSTVRSWWSEWNRYPEVADTTVDWNSKVPNFSVIRTYARVVCAEATALAVEGRGDEAVELLIPLFQGAGKLQAHSIALVRAMIAIVIRGMAVDTAGVVLDRGAPGLVAREKLRKAAAASLGGEAGVRRMVAGEFALQLQGIRRMEKAAAGHPVGWASALIFNPRRTYNEIGDLLAELMELAARRDDVGITDFWKRNEDRWKLRFRIKNQGGRSYLQMALPHYGKVVGNYWEKEDSTSMLLKRLAGADGGSSEEESHP